MTANYEYKVGGSLGENAPSYVIRQADSDLYHGLKAGEFCYIFNSRQMGKSSLIVRTKEKLQAEGFACAYLDFSVTGSSSKLEEWYAGIVYKLVTNFNLGEPSELMHNWWLQRSEIAPVQRLEEFIETVLLVSVQSKIIIFIDEIDSILSLGFSTDDFFALIRSCYEKRNFNSEYQRLTFALIGVATPSDLISDKRRTPFNIGRAIQLDGFKDTEVEPLANGFKGKVENPLVLMREVLTWTGGQPFLTQKVCTLLIQSSTTNLYLQTTKEERNKISDWVEEVVKSQIIENWEAHDEPVHLKNIQNRMLEIEQVAGSFLGWYQQILLSGEITADESTEKMGFRLTGLVVKQQDKLRVYNKIYPLVFNLNWVEKELGKLRPYSQSFQAWVDSSYQDESRLLRGQALQDALTWANGKNLSNEDSRYLAASQDLEKKELVAALVVKEEEGRILAEANDKLSSANETLTDAQHKAKRRIRLGNIIFAVSLCGAIVAIILAGIANKQRQEAEIITGLEQSSARLLRLSGSPLVLENLTDAMQSAMVLKELVKDSRQLKEYPAISPLLALQTVIENIHEKNRLQGHMVGFTSDGKTIATILDNDEGSVKLWNLQGEEIITLKHNDSVNYVVFSTNGKTIATILDDGTAKLWNLQGEEIAILSNKVRSLEFNPDGETVATVLDDGTAKLWNRQGREIAILKHSNEVRSLIFSPDGKTVATGNYDGTAKLWNLQGKEITTFEHGESLVFSPDGKTVATGSHDGTVKLWNLQGKEIATFKHNSRITSLVFSPDGKTVATGSKDKAITKLWNLKGKEIAALENNSGVLTILFSPDGKTVATGTYYGASVWNLQGKEIATLQPNYPDWRVEDLVFSSDGKTVVTKSRGNTTNIWNVQRGEIVALKNTALKNQQVISSNEKVISPNGKTIAIVLDDGTAKLRNLQGREIATLKHDNRVNDVVFSPNGKILATASWDKTAKLWNLQGREIATLKHDNRVNDVAFSPDGKILATASDGYTVRLWTEVRDTWQQLAEYQGSGGVFSLDGKLIAIKLDEDTAQLHRIEDLDDLLARGCKWLQDYLATHPDVQERLKVCK